jgi:exodeoxyribonuclease V alpha subunit
MSPIDDEAADAVYLGWEIARCAPGLTPDEAHAVSALSAACLVAIRAGSTRIPTSVDRLSEVLANVGAAKLADVAAALLERARAGCPDDPVSRVLGRPGRRTPLIVEGFWLSTERMLWLETEFCGRIGRFVARSAPLLEGETLERVLRAATEGPPPLTEEQVSAVRAALTLPIALVTGGPGTGKTTVVAGLLRALRSESNVDVALAAPTGKAALRMRDALEACGQGPSSQEPTPMTLHRLLGWSPTKEKFARDEGDPLPHGLVVVDEASMIDLVLMDRLLRSLRHNAHLVLLGDPNQLPSVDAGAVFRDMCTVLQPARLTVNLRVSREPSARSLVTVAQTVQRGAFDGRVAHAIAVRPTPSHVVFEGVEHLSEPWAVVGSAMLDRWWAARIRALDDFGGRIDRVHRAPNADFDDASVEALRVLSWHYASSRLLCATRSRQVATGAEALNDSLLFRLRAEMGRRRTWHGRELMPGTPVLTERNDYARDLWNGDQGIVVWVDAGRGPELRAVFPRGETFVHFPLSELTALIPAFATTVHKAQGSEFDHVAVVLPEVGSPLSTRELLYTAITRARRSVLIVGEPERLAHAVSRCVTRESGVAERLATMKP